MILISKGNTSAFQVLYQRHSPIVLGYAFKIVRQRPVAEDISQEVWVKVVRLASAYRGEGSVKGWLLTIVRNQSLTYLRIHKKMLAVQTQEALEKESVSLDVKETEDTLLRTFDLANLKKAVDELPADQRLALLFWITENMSYEQIATELNTTESAVKSLLFRARKTLLEQRRVL